jgi:endosialidase-like protein
MMKGNKTMKTITNITYPAFALFALACFALPPEARAVCQDGCGSGNANTFLGDDALVNNTTGTSNTAIGADALFSNTTGINNTAIGDLALFSNTTGETSVAMGNQALYFNTTGGGNTGIGTSALHANTTGTVNTGVGDAVLYSNTIGNTNTAIGNRALFFNTTGSENTANGGSALESNTTGFDNNASGLNALFSNTTGNFHAANGAFALYSNTTGTQNTASGYDALYNNTTGNNNIALGFQAGMNLTTGNSNIDIGNVGVAGDSKRIRIGKQGTQTATFIAGISGATVPTGVAVIVDATGHLGTTTSSARFKETIKPMDNASEAILALKPVTFHYKKEIDPDRIPQFGLLAEDVEKVSPDLIVRDADGKPYTVRYEAVNAMLLNEFLKEHRTVQAQQQEIEGLRAELKEQRTLIQKVHDKVELNRPAPQTVANDQ